MVQTGRCWTHTIDLQTPARAAAKKRKAVPQGLQNNRAAAPAKRQELPFRVPHLLPRTCRLFSLAYPQV